MYDSNTQSLPQNVVPLPTDTSVMAVRFRAIKEHLFSHLNDEAVILSLKNGKYYGLNSVGVTIWTNVQKAATLVEIESAVLSEYDVDEATCRREVSVFLDHMITEELVERIDETDS